MPKVISKLLVSVLVFVVLLFSFVPAVSAASGAGQTTNSEAPGPWYNQNFLQWSSKVFDDKNPNEIFGERYTYAQVNWIINSLIAVVVGSNIMSCVGTFTGDISKLTCLRQFSVTPPQTTTPSATPKAPTFRQTDPTIGLNGGAIGGLAFLTNTILNARPASGIEYVKDTASRLHLVPQAYAQGVGFKTLNPVVSLWSVVRNISYALMVVVIIAMAFMIMFRVKISPQLVISVQSALPRVVSALVLITFSYAIAGFLVDLMYVVVGAFAAMIGIGGTTISTSNVGDLFAQLTSGNGLWSISVGLLIFAILLTIIAAALGFTGVLVSLTGVGAGPGGATIAGGVVLLIGVVFILFILLRLFWLIIRTAAVTILLIILGPMMILGGTLSVAGGFGGWIKNLLANLAVYPTVIIMIFLSHYFFWGWFLGPPAGGFGGCGKGSFNTFCINVETVKFDVVNLPGMPTGTPVLGFFLAFLTLFMIPKAAEIIQGVITGKGVGIQAAIGEAVVPPQAVLAGHFARVEEANKTGTPPGTGKNPAAQFLRGLGMKV